MKGGRKLSEWNLFVKKIYDEGKSKDENYEFGQALADASERKKEMKMGIASGIKSKKSKKSKKSRKGTKKNNKTKGTRRNRKH